MTLLEHSVVTVIMDLTIILFHLLPFQVSYPQQSVCGFLTGSGKSQIFVASLHTSENIGLVDYSAFHMIGWNIWDFPAELKITKVVAVDLQRKCGINSIHGYLSLTAVCTHQHSL